MKNFSTGRLNGFTLVELLVVVLIIGILAAVALPQYQVAVEKSRATQNIVRLNALKTGATSYYLANGAWPSDVTLLDIDITKDAKTIGTTNISATEHTGVIYKDGSACAITSYGAVGCYTKNTYIVWYFTSSLKYCSGYTEVGDSVCKSMGGFSSNNQCGGGKYPCYVLP